MSLISADGTQRWDGKAWAPRTPTVSAPVAAPAPATVAPAVAAPATAAGLDLENRPSWLPVESAQIVLSGAGALAAPPAPSHAIAATPSPLHSDGGSTWVQQTYHPGGGPAKPKVSPILIGAAAFLILALTVGGAYVYQQQAAAPSAPAADAAHLSAAGLMSAAKIAIGGAGSYHLLASSGAASEDITVGGPKDASIDLKSPAGTVSMMQTGGLQFLKAPAVFYADKNPVLAKNAADQWIIIPIEESLIPLTSVLNLSRTADCIVGRHGTLKKVGPMTLDGQSVVEVDDAGEIPSGTPAHFFFSRDGGQLLGIDVIGASTPGGADPTCNGGLGIHTDSFSTVEKYRFDHWGSTLNVRMPGGIDLTQKPWCSTIVGSGLNATVQQFLLAAYILNQRYTTVEANGCGCQSGNWFIFSDAAVAEINASEEFAQSVGAIAFSGQAKTDAASLVQAFHGRDAVMRQGLAKGTFSGFHAIDPQRAPYETAIGVALLSLRADLALRAGTCTYMMP